MMLRAFGCRVRFPYTHALISDSSYLIAFVTNLLARATLRIQDSRGTTAELDSAVESGARLMAALRRAKDELEWEVALTAWNRCNVILGSVRELVPSLAALADGHPPALENYGGTSAYSLHSII